MTLTDHTGLVKTFPYITRGNSRKRIYYNPRAKKIAGGWLVIKPIPYNGKRECARRLRQMKKAA